MNKNPNSSDSENRITELEKQAKELEAERNSIINSIPFPAWIKNKAGEYIHVNQLFLERFGLTYEKVIGHTAFDIFPYETAQVYSQEDHKVIENAHSINFQIKRGEQWYLTIKSPVLSATGEIIGTTGFERNINDNIETLNTLRKERDLLQALMDNIPDLIFYKDILGRYIRINKAKAIILGLNNPYDAIGKSDFDFYPDEIAEKNKEEEDKIITTGEPLINNEECFYKDNGEIIWYSTTKSPIKDEQGNIKGLVCISRNITNQKNIIQTLDKERNFLEVLMDNIPYTIYFKDKDCRFTKINKAQAKFLGITDPDEAIGKTDFDYFDGIFAKQTYEDEQKIIQTGEEQIQKVEQIRDINGNSWWVSATKVPVRDNKGNITGIVGISIDITEKRRAEEKLKEAKEKAEESDRLKTAFLANMSHEIRTPMNGIIGFSNLLRNPDLTQEERNEFINHINNCGNTLLNLIDDIIDISKIESGQLKIKITECNINEIIDELYDIFENTRKLNGKETIEIKTKKSLNDNEASILTDHFRLKQILNNLMSNALKFTQKGFIELGYSLKNNIIEFYVKDTGIGIPKEKQHIIFERFGQVLDANYFLNLKGTGLGLSISLNLIKLLGGEMWVESDTGKGSTFYFTIPYHPTVYKSSKNDKKPSEESYFPDLKDKIILIAEDEEVNFIYLKYLLKDSEAEILWAKNGEEAINIAKSNPDISLILMDFKLPKIDGFEATKIIKSMYPNVPIIAQTAYAMSDERQNAMEAGCDGYVSKPIKIEELQELLNRFFNVK